MAKTFEAKGPTRGASTSAQRVRREPPPASSTPIDTDEIRMRSELLWDAPARPSRGPKPVLSRDDVVRAAISVADGNNLAALTMHAVAAQLGCAPMAL